MKKIYNYKGKQYVIKRHARLRMVLQEINGGKLIISRDTFLKGGGYTS